MQRLRYGTYQGFKLGLLVIDSLALSLDVKKEADSRTLHAVKNIISTETLQREAGVCAVNGVLYTTGGK